MVIVGSNLLVRRAEMVKANKNLAVKTVNDIARLMYSKTQSAAAKALVAASGFSKITEVKEIYEDYYKSKKIDSLALLMKQNIEPYVEKIERATGVLPKVHFYLPPARSFVRLWSNKKGDDLSSFRNMLLRINENHKPLKGIEIGRDGFSVRGVAPIFNENKQYLGAVEVAYPFNNILKKIVNGTTEDYALFLRSNQLKIATGVESGYAEENITKGDYYLIKKSGKFNLDLLNDKEFLYFNENIHHKIIGDYAFALIPIQDFLGKNVGLAAIQLNISEGNAAVRASMTRFVIMASIIILITILILVFLISRIISKPIKMLSLNIRDIAKGKLIDAVQVKSKDEVGLIYESFNTLLNRLKMSTRFAKEIGQGNLDVEIKDVHEDDALGMALIEMKNNLLKAKDLEKKQKIEEKKRNWATKGHAEFGEILRQKSDDIEVFSINILKNLVQYTNSNQGGLFILNDKDPENIVLELTAAYAYNRQKYIEKKIKLNEGLVGACAMEKQTIYMTDVPDNYVNITSGLGEANPRNILIVPLKIEESVFGVIELASFTLYEDYQIEFVEKLAESIASTLNSVKINMVTAQLLEQSQQQAEELAAQEEEMRQNLEEMQATQEEARRREEQLMLTINAIDTTFGRMELNMKRQITFINEKLTTMLGYSVKEIIGNSFMSILNDSDMVTIESLWHDLGKGKIIEKKVSFKLKTDEKIEQILIFYPILKETNVLDKVVVIQK
jgi:PAS domain-containing protein